MSGEERHDGRRQGGAAPSGLPADRPGAAASPGGPDGPGGPAPARIEDFPSLVAFGERVVAARPRRWRGRLGVSGLSVVVAFTGTTALALAAATGSPVPPFLRAGDESTVLRPDPASVRISAARAADPAGGDPWSVRVGRAGDGTACVTVGQVRGSVLGLPDAAGRFRAIPPRADAQCGSDPGAGTGAATVPVVGLRDLRALTGRRVAATVLYGVAAHGPDEVLALLPNGRRVRADLAPDGSFVAVLPGEPRQAQPIVEVRKGRGGQQVPFHLPRTLPDPDPDGTPWTLVADQDGQRVVDGRPIGHSNPTCFRLRPAGGFRRARDLPAVCGAPEGPWATVTPLRRGARGSFVVGSSPVPVVWTGLPDRTLVTIRAPGGRRGRMVVRLRAGGRNWALRRVGSEGRGREPDGVWFGLLPGVVRAAEVRVGVQPEPGKAEDPAPRMRPVPVRQVDLRKGGGTRP